MPQYIDCYFLIDSSISILTEAFLDKFIPVRGASAEDYLVSEKVFLNTRDLLLYLEEKPTYSYSIYWSNKDPLNKIKHGMAFYTTDGMMIFGVSIEGNDPDNDMAISLYRTIKTFTNADIGCMTVEEAPPDNALEFKAFCENRFVP